MIALPVLVGLPAVSPGPVPLAGSAGRGLRQAAGISIRPARLADVPAILSLLDEFAARGFVLPRTPEQVYRHLREYVVAVDELGVVGCAALRIHGPASGEVCALAVAARAHGRGIGRRLVETLLGEARLLPLSRLFAMTLQEAFFLGLGFRPVSLEEVPEKIAADRADGIDRVRYPKRCVLLEL